MTRRGFWLAQLAWWCGYVAILHFSTLPGLEDRSLTGQVLNACEKLPKAALGLVASLALARLYRDRAIGMPTRPLAALVFGCSFILGLGWELAIYLAYGRTSIDRDFLRAATLPVFVLLAWSAIYVVIVYREHAAAETDRARQATVLATEAELAMLRYQINPHFLFNALNSLRALVDDNPAAARTMITQLADLFRYSLGTIRDDSTVADEIRAIRNYLDIQAVRFEDRLQARVAALDEDTAATRLPGFLIQPLVENAVKYGLETSVPPLRLLVRVARRGAELDVLVTNSGRWLGEGEARSEGTGTGLRNLRARLAHLYPERHRLALDEVEGEVRASLRIELVP